MDSPKRLTVTVTKGFGHSVHGLFPGEPAVCVLEVPGTRQQRSCTGPAKQQKTTCHWDEKVEFDYEGGTPHALHVELHGQLPSGVDDLVCAGDVDLHEVLERGTRQVIEVPLTKGGRELGAVELCIEHQAMPDRH